MSAFFTGQIMQKTEWILVKQLTQCVYLDHFLMTECTHKWLDIYPFFKLIQKHNCIEILFDWYNSLVLMRTGCEIKNIETQNDVIWENTFYWKT